jgi:hypothetical protein
MRGEGGDIHDDMADAQQGEHPEGSVSDLLVRVENVVGEIEALKRERHDEGLFSTRLEFASVYFRKRGRQRSETVPKRAASAA